jgi:signal transduction histidine kinase
MHQRITRIFRKRSLKDLTTLTTIIAILVTGLGVLTTYIYVHTVEERQKRDFVTAETLQLRGTVNHIQSKLAAYQQILLAGATAVHVKSSEAITRQNWQQFYETSYVHESFPGILCIGFTQYIPAADLPAYTQKIRDEGYPDFAVYPGGDRSEYTSISFIEPFNATNKRAFGYDMFSEPTRRTAMTQARDSGTFALTAPVVLKQDETGANIAPPKSVLLYYPIYRDGLTPASTAERRERLVGYVYVAIRVKDMLAKQTNTLGTLGINYTLSDTTTASPAFIYEARAKTSGPLERIAQTVELGSRRWTVQLAVPKSVVGKQADPMFLFLYGLGASTILGALVFLLLRSRLQAVKTQHQTELQQTRDELLALTSHQLRTPASGVKQYLGMLRQGYFGELTDEQRTIADKAYLSNDRQLEIIDQLLYVAKADANQLIVQPNMVDLVKLTEDIVDTMRETAAQKNIAIQTKQPAELTVVADERFVRMIIENLISNALKYSYNDSAITVRLTKKDEHAVVSVADHGVGIAEKDRDKLFKKFSRIQNALSSKEGGSGLGLYLAQRLAEAHGGAITVTTQPGKGARFALTIPVYTKTEHNVIDLAD